MLCRLGYHTGPWVPTTGDTCDTIRRCRRCGDAEYDKRHNFQVRADGLVRYVTDDECWAQNPCLRCGEFGGPTLEMHKWSPYQRVLNSDGNVIMERTCDHCGGYQQKAPVYVD